MSQPLTLRTEVGDEDLDLSDFEARVRRGEVSPQCLVRFPVVTGDGFVPACDLEVWRSLHQPRRAHFARAFSLLRFPWLTTFVIFLNLGIHLWTVRSGPLDMDAMVTFGGAYMLVIIVEPLADLAVLAGAKALNALRGSPLVGSRLYNPA